MQISTSRFGTVSCSAGEIWLFPHGLIGLDDHKHWILLADPENERLGWLQNLCDHEMALPVVSPREYCPNYDVHVKQADIAPLELADDGQALVFAIVAKNGFQLTVNLQAPLLVNKQSCIGRQVLVANSQPLRLPVGTASHVTKAAA
ncbi:MAG: hypothetical protein CMJ75_05835 [Planctomycetaceae bacterium]|nr:hypothetical protein [Planctomycetaceae bacterium]